MVRHQVGLLRLSGGLGKRVHTLLDETEDDIAAQITRWLANHTGLDTPASVRRLERLLARIRATRAKAWDEVTGTWVEELWALAQAEPVTTADIIRTVSPVQVALALPPDADLAAIVTRRPFEGKVLRDWAKNIERADLDRIQSQIRIGVVAGESARAIARRVVGTVRNKGKDGVTQVTRHNAEAITRTAVNHVSNRAREAFFVENKDVFSEEQYVSTLDSRTSPVCRSLDGKRYPVGKGRFPPQHVACRSIRVAVTNGEVVGSRPANPTTERMLLREYTAQSDIGRVARRANLPRGHKGKFDAFARRRKRELIGQVPAKTTYQDWLKRQSAAFQDDVLGKARGKLFREGRLPLDTFVDQKGQTLTLAQLGRKEAAAFRGRGTGSRDRPATAPAGGACRALFRQCARRRCGGVELSWRGPLIARRPRRGAPACARLPPAQRAVAGIAALLRDRLYRHQRWPALGASLGGRSRHRRGRHARHAAAQAELPSVSGRPQVTQSSHRRCLG